MPTCLPRRRASAFSLIARNSCPLKRTRPLLGRSIPVSIVIFLQQKRARARTQALLRELNVAHTQLSAYALRVEELTMVNERQRLARELHDTLTQGVAGLIMQRVAKL